MGVPAQQVMSILTPQEVQTLGGLPGQAVAGLLVGPFGSPGSFRPNRVFVDFLHDVVRSAGPTDPELQAAAQAQGEGSVVIVDLRTPEGPQGRVPPEDILGAFEVKAGQLVPGSYLANPNYVVLTRHGLVRLPPGLRAAFVHSLPRVSQSSA